jgi:hypothetical protein
MTQTPLAPPVPAPRAATTVAGPRDDDPLAPTAAPGVLYARHAARNTVPQGRLRTDLAPKALLRALQITLAKPTVSRKRLPIRLDTDRFLAPDFVYDDGPVLRAHAALQQVPADRTGLAWVHLPNGVQFSAFRDVDIPYDELVQRVDISRVGDCFRDVLGITTQVLRRDESGRPTLQLERIAALAQPNYTAFLGKDELDVYKLERIEYGPDEQRSWMRTVCSPNASTSADESWMAFRRLPDPAKARIEFVAHQTFPRPRIMVATGLSRWPWFVVTVTENAYRRFWHDTLGNVLRRYEGASVAIGRPARPVRTSRRTGGR